MEIGRSRKSPEKPGKYEPDKYETSVSLACAGMTDVL
jgi:hypothetical protein